MKADKKMDKENGKLRHLSRAGLAVELSKVRGFSNPKVSVEQYITDSEIAATVLWDAYMKGDIRGMEEGRKGGLGESESNEGKVIADLGCGTGILGIGAMLLGASKVYFVESDALAMETAKENVKKVKSESLGEFFLGEVSDFNKKADTVIMNPPFGVKKEHSDRKFLEKAFETGDVVYSFHKSETREFVERLAMDKSFKVDEVIDFEFPLKASMKFHKKRIKRIKVSCLRLIRE